MTRKASTYRSPRRNAARASPFKAPWRVRWPQFILAAPIKPKTKRKRRPTP